jgi:hypothetical protein
MDRQDHQQGDRDRQHDRHAAEPRDRAAVHLAILIRVIEADAGVREPDHPRCGEKRDEEAEQQKADREDHATAPFALGSTGQEPPLPAMNVVKRIRAVRLAR